MNYTEHYHDWLRDAHAMEKQAESMLESMASRIENYPDIKARIEQHISETKHQITMLEEVLDRNGISRSVLKDSMSKMAAMGQSIGGMFPSDEIVKGSISGYVFVAVRNCLLYLPAGGGKKSWRHSLNSDD